MMPISEKYKVDLQNADKFIFKYELYVIPIKPIILMPTMHITGCSRKLTNFLDFMDELVLKIYSSLNLLMFYEYTA